MRERQGAIKNTMDFRRFKVIKCKERLTWRKQAIKNSTRSIDIIVSLINWNTLNTLEHFIRVKFAEIGNYIRVIYNIPILRKYILNN